MNNSGWQYWDWAVSTQTQHQEIWGGNDKVETRWSSHSDVIIQNKRVVVGRYIMSNIFLFAYNSCFDSSDFLLLWGFMWTISVFQCDEKIYKITSLTFLCNQIVHVKTFYSCERQETLEWKGRRKGIIWLLFSKVSVFTLQCSNVC